MATVTLEQIKENFPTSFTAEERTKIYESLSSSMSYDEAQEMFLNIIENVEKAVNNGEVPDYDEWSKMDKILWAIKEAYVFGQIAGMEMTMELNQMGMNTLFGEEASGGQSK